jgi:hypothetical protein
LVVVAPTPGPTFHRAGCGAVERTSRRSNARTWYADSSPGTQHFVMLVAASLMVLVLIAIALVVLAVFGVSADGAL